MNLFRKTALLGSYFVFNVISTTFPVNSLNLPMDNTIGSEISELKMEVKDEDKILVGVKKEEVKKEEIKIEAKEKVFSSDQMGVATYYADYFHGRRTASGEVFDMNGMTTAANNEYAFGTILRVTNRENGKSVEVKVNDRGAFEVLGVTLDLSKGAFEAISPLSRGRILVDIEVLSQ